MGRKYRLINSSKKNLLKSWMNPKVRRKLYHEKLQTKRFNGLRYSLKFLYFFSWFFKIKCPNQDTRNLLIANSLLIFEHYTTV